MQNSRRYDTVLKLYCWIIILVLLLLNLYRTDSWTGDKPFSEFATRDWILLAVFLVEEVLIVVGGLFIFKKTVKKVKLGRVKKLLEKRNGYRAEWLYNGIRPGDYDAVWFDFSDSRRALVLKWGKLYRMQVQVYSNISNTWNNVDQGNIYDSLSRLKKVLFDYYAFYFEGNSGFDKEGDVVFLENKSLPLNYIQEMDETGIVCLDEEGKPFRLAYEDARLGWCEKRGIDSSDSRCICDRTSMNGKKLIFYANGRFIFFADESQTELWNGILEKICSYGYSSFDAD